jgi:hypothetical protein
MAGSRLILNKLLVADDWRVRIEGHDVEALEWHSYFSIQIAAGAGPCLSCLLSSFST